MREMTKTLMRFRSLALVVGLAFESSAALANCIEPVAPACVDGAEIFVTQQEFDGCRQAVETFRSETKEYLLCLKSEVGGALDHFNDAVDRFNQRVHASNKDLQSSKTARELMY